jgi:DNA-binding beta-propeller fold protein YncE
MNAMKERTASRRGARWRAIGTWIAMVVSAIGFSPASAQDYGYHFLRAFGGPGNGNGEFGNDINFVAISDNRHTIYVEDTSNNRVEVFDADGVFRLQFGSGGTGNGQFQGLAGLAFGHTDLYVADQAGRIEVFDVDGHYQRQFGSPGEGAGQFRDPGALAVDPVTGDVVVADIGNSRVLIFAADGTYLTEFGDDYLIYPCYLAIDPSTRNIIVADEVNNAVYIFDSAGRYLTQFGSFGSDNGQFSYGAPGAVAIDSDTHDLVIQDYGNNRIQVFDADGNYLSQFGTTGNGDGEFNGPTGMALDRLTHNVVVLDRGNARAEIFGINSEPVTPDCGPTNVSLGLSSLTATPSQEILFAATAGIGSPYGGLMSFLIDNTGTIVCTTPMNGVGAQCTHPLQLGTHTIIAQYSGDGFNPPGCSLPQSIRIVPDGTQFDTELACATSPAAPVQGQPVSVTCNVQPLGHAPSGDSTPSGFMSIEDNGVHVADAFFVGGTATYSTTFSGGAHSLAVTYSGDGSFATSDASVATTVETPADDIFYGSFESD